MWEISNSFQITSVLKAMLLGGCLCLFYDIFRSIRKQGKNSFWDVFFQDVIFCLISAPVTFLFLLALTNGELRAYFFISLISGFLIIKFTISDCFLFVLNLIFSATDKLFLTIKRLFYPVFKKIILISNRIFDFLAKKFKNMRIYIKKLLKK